jgi:hypothetical protein
MNQAGNKRCHGCGGEVTPAEIIERKAGLVQGVLLCPQCVEAKRRELMQARAPAGGGATPPSGPPVPPAAQPVAAPAGQRGDEVISLISDDEMQGGKSQMIHSFAEGSSLSGAHHEENLKRPLAGPELGATRTRTFHSKLTDAGLANMDDTINDWLDSHPEIFIKNAATSIDIFEGGKVKERHLFITVFY